MLLNTPSGRNHSHACWVYTDASEWKCTISWTQARAMMPQSSSPYDSVLQDLCRHAHPLLAAELAGRICHGLKVAASAKVVTCIPALNSEYPGDCSASCFAKLGARDVDWQCRSYWQQCRTSSACQSFWIPHATATKLPLLLNCCTRRASCS